MKGDVVIDASYIMVVVVCMRTLYSIYCTCKYSGCTLVIVSVLIIIIQYILQINLSCHQGILESMIIHDHILMNY